MRSLFLAHTHLAWFDHLSRLAERSGGGPARVDEVNFWSPNTTRPPRRFAPGESVFFRLGAPHRKIAGYGFFAEHLDTVDVRMAWRLFGAKNGAPTLDALAQLLGRRTERDLWRPMGCMLLREATFWPDSEWIPWGEERGYATTGIQRGRTDDDPANVALLLSRLARDAALAPEDLRREPFRVQEVDRRRIELTNLVAREGQGTFRARLLKAYGGQCAVTREHTEPVLEAAHIQPYLGPASNHLQNGLVLTQEFHTLFDRGFVCVEARRGEYRLRVSDLLQERWNNGKRYREYDGRVLHVPGTPELRPSEEALEWHRDVVFEKVA